MFMSPVLDMSGVKSINVPSVVTRLNTPVFVIVGFDPAPIDIPLPSVKDTIPVFVIVTVSVALTTAVIPDPAVKVNVSLLLIVSVVEPSVILKLLIVPGTDPAVTAVR